MDPLSHPSFRQDFDALQSVSLNPERHLAPNAHAHTLLVVHRIAALCERNAVSAPDSERLIALAYLHDIGKARGTSRPYKSVELLPEYGVDDPLLTAMVKYHDINLPWHQSSQRGEPPSEKAWQKLARQVELSLLCLFMVADRVDCPGGPKANAALCWFLEEAARRGFLRAGLDFDLA